MKKSSLNGHSSGKSRYDDAEFDILGKSSSEFQNLSFDTQNSTQNLTKSKTSDNLQMLQFHMTVEAPLEAQEENVLIQIIEDVQEVMIDVIMIEDEDGQDRQKARGVVRLHINRNVKRQHFWKK